MLRMHHNAPVTSVLAETEKKNSFECYLTYIYSFYKFHPFIFYCKLKSIEIKSTLYRYGSAICFFIKQIRPLKARFERSFAFECNIQKIKEV